MKSCSTHKCRQTGLDFTGGFSWGEKKKSLSKPEGALVRAETHTRRPALSILKGLVIFFCTSTRTQGGLALDRRGPRC